MSRLPTRGAREASASMRKFMEMRAARGKAERRAYLNTLVTTVLDSSNYLEGYANHEEAYANHEEAYEAGILDATRAAKNWLEDFPDETMG